MMKRLFLITFLLAVCWEAPAQVFRIPEVVVSALPTASAVTRAMFVVSDGASDADCTTGGGSSRVLCYSNGTSWEALGDGGTTSAPGSDTQLIRNSAGAFAATTGLTFSPGQLSLSSVASSYAPINNTMFWRVVTLEANNPDFGFAFQESANTDPGNPDNSAFSWGYNPLGEVVGDNARWSWTVEGHYKPVGQSPVMEFYESIKAGPVSARFNSAAVNKTTGRKTYQYIAGDVINFYDGLGTTAGTLLGGFQGINFSTTGNYFLNTGGIGGQITFGNTGDANMTVDNDLGTRRFSLSTTHVRMGVGTDVIGAFTVGTSPANRLSMTARSAGLAPIIQSVGEANVALDLRAAGTGTVWVNPSVTIGAFQNANASALLDLISTTRGFLPPRMTTAQRDAIVTPATGLSIYNTTTNTNNTYNGTTWVEASGSDNMGNQVATTDLDMSGFNVNDVIKVGNTVYVNFTATGADQTTQITNFLNAWKGYNIKFPAGVYKVHSEITVPERTTIEGTDSTVFSADASDTDAILVRMQKAAKLDNVIVDCSAHDGPTATTDDGCINILAAGDSASVVRSKVIDSYNSGIYIRDANWVTIENNYVSAGISDSTGAHFAIKCGRNCNYLTIRRNSINTNRYGINVRGRDGGGGQGAWNVEIAGNLIDYTGRVIINPTLAIELIGGTGGSPGTGATGAQVYNNRIIPPAKGNFFGISIAGTDGASVHNNILEAGQYGIGMECASCRNVTFTDNEVMGSTGQSVAISSNNAVSPENITFRGNYFGPNPSKCIDVTRAVGLIIDGNHMRDCGAPTISLQGSVALGPQPGIERVTISNNTALVDTVAGFFLDISAMKGDSAWVRVNNNFIEPDTSIVSTRTGTSVKRVANLTGVRHVTFQDNVWNAMTSSGARGTGTAAQLRINSGNVSDVRVVNDHFLNKPAAPAIEDLNTSGAANHFIGIRRTNMLPATSDTYTAQDVVVNDPNVAGTTTRMHASGSFTTGNLVQRAASGAFTDAGVLASNVVSIAGTNAWQNAQTSDETGCTLTDGATVTWNLTDCMMATITLGGNRTIDATTFPVGFGTFILQIKQDATGSRVPTFTSEFKFPGDVTPTFSTAPDVVDYISCVRMTSAILDCTSGIGFSRP